MASLLKRWGARRGRKHFANATDYPSNLRNEIQLYGISGTYGGIYKSQPAVRTVVGFIAEQAAPIGIKLYERVSDEKRLQLDDHDVMKLLRRPGFRTTGYRLWDATFRDFGIYDVAYWGKVRQRGQVRALTRIPPSALLPDHDPVTGVLRGFRTAKGQIVSLDDVIVFQGYHPETNYDQIPPIETIRRILAEEWAAGRYREQKWRTGTNFDGVVERPIEAGEWDDEAREGFLADFEAAYAGEGGSGRIAILEGMKWVDVKTGVDARQMEYLGARKLSRAEVCAFYGIPVNLIDGQPSKDDWTAFYNGKLNAMLTRVEQELELQLLPEFEAFDREQRQYFEFNLGEKLKGSFEESAAIMSTATGGPWLLVNEARARQNLPPVDGGDELITALNTVRGGGDQASPQSPTETPATDAGNLEPAGTTPKPRKRLGTKAGLGADELEAVREPHVQKMQGLLERTYDRQRRAYKGSGKFDSARWNKELAADLDELAVATVAEVGQMTADRIKGQWSTELAMQYWKVETAAAAKEYNDAVLTRLSREDDADKVFDALTALAPEKAWKRVTHVMSWALIEAAKQNGRV